MKNMVCNYMFNRIVNLGNLKSDSEAENINETRFASIKIISYQFSRTFFQFQIKNITNG